MTTPRDTDQRTRLESGDLEGFKRVLLESIQLYADTEAGRSGMGSPIMAQLVWGGIERDVDRLVGAISEDQTK